MSLGEVSMDFADLLGLLFLPYIFEEWPSVYASYYLCVYVPIGINRSLDIPAFG